MSSTESRWPRTLVTFKNVMSTLFRNRRGAVGISTLVLFISAAAAAPLITPYNPVTDLNLGAPYSKPSWYSLSDSNQFVAVRPVLDPGFVSTNSLQEWSLTSTTGRIQFGHADTGNRDPGSLQVTYARDAVDIPGGISTANITRPFDFPYGIPPLRFVVKMAMFFDLPSNIDNVNLTRDDPVEIKLLFEKVGAQTFEVYNASVSEHPYAPFGQRQPRPYVWLAPEIFVPGAGVSHNPAPVGEAASWIAPAQMADSDDTGLKARYGDKNAPTTCVPCIVFNGTGSYTFKIQLNFRDIWAGQQVRFAVTFDDLKVDVLGPTFGLLGTDQLGRDIFSQLLYGARLSLFVGLTAALLTVAIGLLVGLFAGFAGGFMDELLMRFTDMLLILPTIPLLLVLIFVLGQSVFNIVLVIGLLGWPGWAKVVRSQVVSLRERPFVEAAKAVGAGRTHIIGRHILPNVMNLTYVTLATAVPGAIIAEAALSFLGLGDPIRPSWGKMLRDVQLYNSFTKLYWVIPPGICIALVSLSFILIGFALDEILNPKLRIRR